MVHRTFKQGNRRDLPEIEDVEPVSSDHVRGRVHRWGSAERRPYDEHAPNQQNGGAVLEEWHERRRRI